MNIRREYPLPPAPLRWFVIPTLLAALLLLVEQTTDIDRAVSRLAFDAASGGFPLRERFWLEVVMHHWMKSAVIMLASVTVGALVLSFVLPLLASYRRTLLYLALAFALAPLGVTVAKSSSSRHCPWDVDEFGGFAPYAHLLAPEPANVEPGRCFPAGHASTGFALMAFYFAAYRRRMRRAARASLAFGIAAGLVLGGGRVLQGAHFVSHVFASGLLCWCIMLVLYMMVLRERPALNAGRVPRLPDAPRIRSRLGDTEIVEDESRA